MLGADEACRWLRAGRAVPLVRRLSADLLTPVGALLRLLDGEPREAFLFESVERGESIGRYSYVGVDPEASGAADAAAFRAAARGVLAAAAPPELLAGLPRFLGGLVFALDWDYVRELEPRLGAPDAPVVRHGLFREVVAFDHLRQEVLLVHALLPDGAPEAAYARGLDRLARLERALERPLAESFLRPRGAPEGAAAAVVPDLDCAAYAKGVERVQEYIRAGDAFQVVLSRGFERATRASGLDVYRALRMVNPSPYMFYVRLGGRELAGASPEMLCRVEGGVATTHPIAGTRPRGASEVEDRALADELCRDPKERAEHAMLVDLARNDLGRVARAGSVRVTRLMEVERFSHVMHMVSEVKADLGDGQDPLDALDACFPAGTVSGAPKVRAIEILHELEARPRGPYAGAVGSAGITGALDTCIAIRTVLVEGSTARWQAGAGVVVGSVPALEAEETRAKARAMLRAVAVAEQGMDTPVARGAPGSGKP